MSDLAAGTVLQLAYADHNEGFRSQLPRAVSVVRRATARHGVDNWYLVELDEPVTSEGREYFRLLLRSRERGAPLGGPRPVSVFILLVPAGENLPADGFDPHDFIHVAWGVASVLALAD